MTSSPLPRGMPGFPSGGSLLAVLLRRRLSLAFAGNGSPPLRSSRSDPLGARLPLGIAVYNLSRFPFFSLAFPWAPRMPGFPGSMY